MHIPVLLNEVIKYLRCKKGGIYADCTLGCGGHAEGIMKEIMPEGLLIVIDRDSQMLAHAELRFKKYKKNTIFVKGNFRNLVDILKKERIKRVDGILFDLGLSSVQLDNKDRGFSFRKESTLDMRMDRDSGVNCHDIVNSYSQGELQRVIMQYGEEPYANRIARRIVFERGKAPINTTLELSSIVERAIPNKHRRRMHPATRTFMALRIEVNDELNSLKDAIPQAIESLKKGGRLCILTYQSLEDRIVKKIFREYEKGCTCPKDFPICICNKKKKIRFVTKKPICPSLREIESNPRSRSAKLYIAEKI